MGYTIQRNSTSPLPYFGDLHKNDERRIKHQPRLIRANLKSPGGPNLHDVKGDTPECSCSEACPMLCPSVQVWSILLAQIDPHVGGFTSFIHKISSPLFL